MARLLLDTHAVLGMIDPINFALPRAFAEKLDGNHELFASSISLWEIAIKNRLGKLPLAIPLVEWPSALTDAEIGLLDLSVEHILAELEPLPSTKDPFDRLLLAIAHFERLEFVTIDRALIDHPLAWRP